MNSERHSPRRRNMSRSPHYGRNNTDYNERSVSPHRRFSSGRRSPSTSPYNNHMSYKTQYRSGQDSDYSDGRHSRNSRRSYSSGSDYDYFTSREKDRDYDHARDRDRDRDWDRERSRSREYRERHYHKDRDYDSHHRDRFRREKNRDRRSNKDRRSRDRDRNYRDDDRDSNEGGRERSPINSNANSGFDSGFYKNQPPNNTIMIRGLAQHITENDVRQDIINCGLMPKDIRLIRKKDTGASRGFAFVEFTTLQEATRWMEMKQVSEPQMEEKSGVLMLQDQYRAIMQYSIPKDASQQSEKPPSSKATADWFCIKCGAQNFKRRDNCFKCHASRMESEEGGSGSDEVCTYATKTIMLRNLDALTTEDSVMTELKNVIPDMVSLVSGVLIGRDPLTSTSRGICYLALESTCDALTLYGALTSLEAPLTIDGKTAIISYCKYHMGDVKKAFSQMQFPTASQPNFYSMNDLNSLADYSASRYAKTSGEYQQYFQYYKMYFAQQITEGASITLNSENQMDSANAAAALAQNAILQRNSSKAIYDQNCTMQLQIPNGIDGKKYPVPDVNKYHYDKNTGYFYDPSTGLYYDRNSQYYYNSVIQKYLYWDNEKYTYLLAPTTNETVTAAPTTSTAGAEISQPADAKKPKLEKQDRVKVAKKIAKDMERWAKNLNQKKESARAPIYESQIQSNGTSTASADIGFAVLEKKNNVVTTTTTTSAQPLNVFSGQQKAETFTSKVQSDGLVASYGGSSDTSGDEETDDGNDCLDWEKLVCLLCKRQFFSKEDLSRHKDISALHKKNLELRYLQKSLESGKKLKYRDRAKERRLKYGESDEPQPSRLKEKYLKAREVPEPPVASASSSDPIGSENVGNRLLQKMGWTEGQGLGKSNQGRTTIIQAEQRLSTVGLGSKQATYTALPGETYKDCVKKMMFARYQELAEQG